MKRIFIITALLCSIVHAQQLPPKSATTHDLAHLKQTPRELKPVNTNNLMHYVKSAQVKKFKFEYNDDLCTAELKQELLDTAQKTKTTLQKELKFLGKRAVHPATLGRGIVQATVGLWALFNIYRTGDCCYKVYGKDYTKVFISPDNASRYFFAGDIVPYFFTTTNEPVDTPGGGVHYLDPNLTKQQSRFLSGVACSFASLSIIAAATMPYAFTNIKQGINYKAHLEQQIKNLDEIIAYIQLSQTITNHTGELI